MLSQHLELQPAAHQAQPTPASPADLVAVVPSDGDHERHLDLLRSIRDYLRHANTRGLGLVNFLGVPLTVPLVVQLGTLLATLVSTLATRIGTSEPRRL